MNSEEELVYPNANYLPVLYATDKRGKSRMWKIWTIDDVVHRCSGLTDGKKQFYQRREVGMNKGRKNETTAEEQADLKMNRMWTKQLDKGYAPKCKEGLAMYKRVMAEKGKSGGINRTASAKIGGSSKKTSKTSVKSKNPKNLTSPDVKVPIIPMKAQTWTLEDSKDPKSVLPRVTKYFDFKKGVYVQYKIDGFRCTARLQDGNVILTSNTNKQYPWFANLRKEVKEFLDSLEYIDALDCEVYTHTIVENGKELPEKQRFSAIQSISGMSRTNPHPLEDQICLYVFDLVDISKKIGQDERFRLLNKLFKQAGSRCPHIKKVETRLIYSIDDVYKYHGKFSELGYEGIIIRDRSLMYQPKHRSLRMRKFKHFMDEEYVIVGANLKVGVDSEYFVWVCKTEDGNEFKAKPTGIREQRREWYANRAEYIGRRLTVKFQEYSDDGVPRFPIGKAIREEGDG